MKIYKPTIILIIFAIIGIGVFYAFNSKAERLILGRDVNNSGIVFSQNSGNQQNPDKPEVMIQDLAVPWESVFLPNGSILITERVGKLKKIGNNGFEIAIPGVESFGEGGMLGIALHPDYASNDLIYLYHTTRTNAGLKNVVERYKLSENQLTDKLVIIENIPASEDHNGGRIKFGPDRLLYITTGDTQNNNTAQDRNSLAGKILRLKEDGGVPEDNPFGNPIYSYGHRNVQGIAWDSQNNLWATEHGRSGSLSGYDELNLINKGANYGWPQIQGDETRAGMEVPVINSGVADTWAPSGMTYQDGSIFFSGLRGQALYEYKIASKELVTHFKGEFGRIRNVITGPDKNLYILTNNTDGRGVAKDGDDKMIKINFSLIRGDDTRRYPSYYKWNALLFPSVNKNIAIK